MKRALLSLFLLAAPAVLQAGEFDWIARHFERDSGCERLRIPFFGLARFVVAVAHPAGTSELNLAIFEKPGLSVDRFNRIVDDAVGNHWKPMVRVRSRNGESTNIYAQEIGRDLRLMIGTLDRDDATLVEVRVRPDKLIKFVDEMKKRSHSD